MAEVERDTMDRAIEDRDIPHHKKGHLKDEEGMVGRDEDNIIQNSPADRMKGHDQRAGVGEQNGARKTEE